MTSGSCDLYVRQDCCIGLVLGRMQERETRCFLVQSGCSWRCRAGRVRGRYGPFVFFSPLCSGGFKVLWVCSCVRSYRVFWNLQLQITVEGLYDCCHVLLSCAIHAGHVALQIAQTCAGMPEPDILRLAT